MKKRLFALLLAGLLAVSAAGCGGAQQEASPSPSPTSKAESVGEFCEKFQRFLDMGEAVEPGLYSVFHCKVEQQRPSDHQRPEAQIERAGLNKV